MLNFHVGWITYILTYAKLTDKLITLTIIDYTQVVSIEGHMIFENHNHTNWLGFRVQQNFGIDTTVIMYSENVLFYKHFSNFTLPNLSTIYN